VLAAFSPVEQRYLFEARQMQTLSLAVHIPLVCFGVAFPAMTVFAEWLGLRTGDPLYTRLAYRWSKVIAVLFAVGAVSGTILSFELGMLWPGWMAAFGSVFGLAFALEGFAFFTEAIFLGIYIYSWGRISPRMHVLAGVPVAIAGFLGSFMVIAVNGWMNHPQGFGLRSGRVVDVHPFNALFENTYFWHELVHMYLAGYMTAGFIVAGIYAFGWLRGRRTRYHRIALVIPLTAAALASPAEIVVGDWAGRDVAATQPVKLAAMEGLGRTETGAAEDIGGWYENGDVRYGIAVPHLLSVLAYHDPDATVRGLDTVPPKDQPPVNVTRLSFQAMVACGTALAVLAAVFFWVWWRTGDLPRSRWFHRAVIAAGPLALIALETGWTVTEVGRQPWIVYRTMRVSQAVTGASGIPVGYLTLVATYLLLAAVAWWVLRRLSRVPGAEATPLPGDAGYVRPA